MTLTFSSTVKSYVVTFKLSGQLQLNLKVDGKISARTMFLKSLSKAESEEKREMQFVFTLRKSASLGCCAVVWHLCAGQPACHWAHQYTSRLPLVFCNALPLALWIKLKQFREGAGHNDQANKSRKQLMSNSAAHENICCFRVENQVKVGVNSSMYILSI